MSEIIYLYDYKGNTTIFKNKEDVVEKLGFQFIEKNVTKFICSVLDQEFYIGLNRADYGLYILRNEYNEKLLPYDFLEAANLLKNKNKDKIYKKYNKKYFWNGVGAVPGTGKKKWYGRYFRHPKTLNVLRYAYSEYEEFEPINKVRGGPRSIPTAYSDIMKPEYKNWKYYRKTQYRC